MLPDAYFHPCLFPVISSHVQICPIQLDAFPCFGAHFPFLLLDVDPSRKLSKRGLRTPRNDVNHDNGSS